jgi:transposase
MTSVLSDDRLFEVEMGEAECLTAAPAGEAKTFRRYDLSQQFLLPPSLDEWLDDDDEARFVSEVVDDLLDLSSIYRSYESASGAPPYEPRMMLKLLVYGYATGVTSSREIERRCKRDVGFRWLAANATPDYRSISRFRRRHLDALQGLFLQVLGLCAKAGLVKLGRVALDATLLVANASRHKAMSYDHIVPRIEELQAEVDAMLAEAEAVDRAEDEAFGEDRRGDEVPPELRRRETRLQKLRAAKEAMAPSGSSDALSSKDLPPLGAYLKAKEESPKSRR